MSKIIKPPKLQPGDTVGIASPASAYSPAVHEGFLKRSLAYLKGLGLKARLAENALQIGEHLNPPAWQRAQDLNTLFADPEIKAIFCLYGGSGANAVLPLLYWQTIAASPKIVLGYSAITALLLGLYAQTKIVTFHGPMMLNGFSEYPELFPYTRQQLEQTIFKPEPPGPLKPPTEWTDDYPQMDSPRQMKPNSGWRWLRPGKAAGPLIGGNLHTLLTLAGTPYWPVCQGAILFLEEVNMGNAVLLWLEESLAQGQQLGLFAEISGLVVGKINNLSETEERLFEELVEKYTHSWDFPILTQVDFGHTDPKLVLPIGVRASLDAEQDQFCLVEAAVRS